FGYSIFIAMRCPTSLATSRNVRINVRAMAGNGLPGGRGLEPGRFRTQFGNVAGAKQGVALQRHPEQDDAVRRTLRRRGSDDRERHHERRPAGELAGRHEPQTRRAVSTTSWSLAS